MTSSPPYITATHFNFNFQDPPSYSNIDIPLTDHSHNSLIQTLYREFADPNRAELMIEHPCSCDNHTRHLQQLYEQKDFMSCEPTAYLHYFGEKSWEQFSLADATFMMSQCPWADPSIWLHCLPHMCEVLLRAERWIEVCFAPFMNVMADLSHTINNNDYIYSSMRDYLTCTPITQGGVRAVTQALSTIAKKYATQDLFDKETCTRAIGWWQHYTKDYPTLPA